MIYCQYNYLNVRMVSPFDIIIHSTVFRTVMALMTVTDMMAAMAVMAVMAGMVEMTERTGLAVMVTLLSSMDLEDYGHRITL